MRHEKELAARGDDLSTHAGKLRPNGTMRPNMASQAAAAAASAGHGRFGRSSTRWGSPG